MCSVGSTSAGAREDLWLALLSRFGRHAHSFVVWKNLDSALFGRGDIDAAAERRDWGVLLAEFRAWADEFSVGPVVICDHIPGGLNMIAVAPELPSFLEVGVKENRLWRGSSLFTVDQLPALCRRDPRGFTVLRPGAEGLFKLLLNGTRYGGRENSEGLRGKRVAELIRSDREGAAAAAELLGMARGAAMRGARAVAAGSWDRPAMAFVEALALVRATLDVPMLARRLYFKLVRRQSCPVVKAILTQDRTIVGDKEAWVTKVMDSHQVYGSFRAG